MEEKFIGMENITLVNLKMVVKVAMEKCMIKMAHQKKASGSKVNFKVELKFIIF
jgi:hypothetical protein